jgi:hypothetical protein
VAKKCPVLDPGWIMVNVNNLSGEKRLLISFGNSAPRKTRAVVLRITG